MKHREPTEMARIFLVFFSLATCAASSVAETVTLGDLLRRDRHFEMELSPDGTHIAYARFDSRRQENKVEFMDLETGEVVNRVDTDSGRASSIEWLDNKNVIMYERGLYLVPIGGVGINRLLRSPLINDDRLYGNSVFLDKLETWWYISMLPDDSEQVLIGSYDTKGYARIHKLNVYTGVIRDVVDGRPDKINEWFLNGNGEPVVGRRALRHEQAFYVRKGSGWQRHDSAFPNSRIRLDYANDRETASAQVIAGMRNDNEVLLAIRNDAGRFDSLVVYDTTTGSISSTIHTDERYAVRLDQNAMSIVRDDMSHVPVAINYAGLSYKTGTWDESAERALEIAREKYPDNGVQLMGGAERLGVWLMRVMSATRGNLIVTASLETGEVSSVFDEYARLEPEALPSLEITQITASDGGQIDAYLWTPPSNVERKAPVLMAQNTTANRHYPWFDPDILYLAGHGHPVLQINPRGVLGYGDDFRRAGLVDGMAMMKSDYRTAADWLKARFVVNELFAFGMAMGAHALYSVAIDGPDVFDALAVYAVPVDLLAFQERMLERELSRDAKYLELMDANTKSGRSWLPSLSPGQSIERLKTPTFMFHAERDRNVPLRQIDDLENTSKRVDAPVTFRRISSRLTGMSDPAVREQYLDLIVRHFRSNTKATEEQVSSPFVD